MNDIKLKVDLREVTGKKVAIIRKQGFVPGVVYGGKDQPMLTQSDYNETEKVVRKAGYHSPLYLEIDGKEKLAMVKNVAVDPVRRRLINIEFHAIKATDAVTAEAPIHLVGLGESEAEKASLVISQVLEDVEIKAKPADLPSAIEVDVTGLAGVEDKITLGDIKLPEGVVFADPEEDLHQVIANVYDPATEAAKLEAEEAEEEKAEAEGAAEEVPAEHGEEKMAEKAE
ncbi:MAG: 50S ribosomal protein L25 [Candidatus Nomurabacteria bacterium]|jgi:large subunit ribosomal protein L25|nr:50S ribosomal protein L25 [Candidatus Nomurabacteria bacterium]